MYVFCQVCNRKVYLTLEIIHVIHRCQFIILRFTLHYALQYSLCIETKIRYLYHGNINSELRRTRHNECRRHRRCCVHLLFLFSQLLKCSVNEFFF